ncbi:MAG: hypothetical protein HY717_06630 [Planctomycetes bacterium]|nr:hypothetical protein [Planctomycetota bacterium]
MAYKTAMAAIWALGIGLMCVYLEVSQVQVGHRVQKQYQKYQRLFEEVRRLEIRYNRLVSPDLLENDFKKANQAVKSNQALKSSRAGAFDNRVVRNGI